MGQSCRSNGLSQQLTTEDDSVSVVQVLSDVMIWS
jgi:hypothetical protein